MNKIDPKSNYYDYKKSDKEIDIQSYGTYDI